MGNKDRVLKAFKYRLRPTPDQEEKLAMSLETHRRIYNDALAQRNEEYKTSGKSLRMKDQYRTFADEIKTQQDAEARGEEGPHWRAHVAAVSMRDTLKRLDKAFDSFFRRVKKGEKPGYPRFRNRDRYDSIPFDNYNSGCALVSPKGKVVHGDMPDEIKIGRHKIKLKKYAIRMKYVGTIKVRLHRPVKGRITTVTIKREGDKWFVVFTCEFPKQDVPQSINPPTGIDVGVRHFTTDAEGEHTPNPQFLKESLSEIKIMSRKIALKDGKKCKKRQYPQRGSRRRNENKRKLRNMHVKVKNRRRANHYKVALKLVRKHGLIGVESLSILGMMGNRKLSRAIADAGWHQFRQILKHKAESAGVQIVEVDPRFTSQRCNQCGHIEKGNRPSQEVFCCLRCGHGANADHNAAKNILERALRLGRAGPAGDNAAPLVLEKSNSKSKRSPKRTPSILEALPPA